MSRPDAPSAPDAFSRLVYPSLTGARATDQADPDVERRTRAEASGHAAGYAAGLRAADRELTARRAVLEAEHADALARLQQATAASLTALAAAGRALEERVVPVLHEAEEALVATALDLASAVVGYEVAASERSRDGDPRVGRTARAALARALDGLDPSVVVRVRLHPADASLVADAARSAGVEVVADPSLRPGDAEADLPTGLVDARLSTALGRARTALLGDGDEVAP
ncbi:flagellar assembly protein FliH [Frigoribacterium sp. PvP120]|uniref:FliH/SctL family protein n=1 Tax=unclassified Frigoribacterium TaxID=2627005 RepID=UPI001AE630C9|nr:FliH/SctL family protein [Frigoribacterium sp. PvP121]MBP1240022.1 flagellar assembly protein FliH [Frigoribacterium sp. PvP121]